MGCSATLTLSFGFRISPLCPPSSSSTRSSHASIKLASFNNKLSSLRLSSSNSISGYGSFFPHNNNLCTIPQRPRSLTIVSAKGYKMKTHKVPSSLSLSLGLCVCVCLWIRISNVTALSFANEIWLYSIKPSSKFWVYLILNILSNSNELPSFSNYLIGVSKAIQGDG